MHLFYLKMIKIANLILTHDLYQRLQLAQLCYYKMFVACPAQVLLVCVVRPLAWGQLACLGSTGEQKVHKDKEGK